MQVKKYIDQIVESGDTEHMHCLSKMFEDLLNDLKETNYDVYIHYKCKLHKMVYGDHLSKEMAQEWVSHMKNKDGTTGEHWTYEQTSSYAGDCDKADFYAAMNMMYSDYYSNRFDTNTYVTLAKDWLTDTDVGEGKTLKYYMYVVN
jgi:hypothetical protein